MSAQAPARAERSGHPRAGGGGRTVFRVVREVEDALALLRLRRRLGPGSGSGSAAAGAFGAMAGCTSERGGTAEVYSSGVSFSPSLRGGCPLVDLQLCAERDGRGARRGVDSYPGCVHSGLRPSPMAPLRRVTLLCACLASPSLAAPATPRQRLRCKTTVAAGDGSFTIELRPDWAPKGVERVLALQKAGFFDDMPFFRAIKNFLIQFGLSPDRQKHTDWLRRAAAQPEPEPNRTKADPDEPDPEQTRTRTRARARARTRTTRRVDDDRCPTLRCRSPTASSRWATRRLGLG